MMSITERIREVSVLPARFNTMLEQALRVVKQDDQRDELCVVACVVSSVTWRYWQAWRLPEDNRQEHEWVVFANVMKIAESEALSLSDKRVATAFAFTHDSFFIPRIMEAWIITLEEKAARVKQTDPQRALELGRQATQLRDEKEQQRAKHMESGARNAEFLLNQLKHPTRSVDLLFTPEEVSRCRHLVGKHDLWKTGEPHPPGSDRLAVVCLEGDALWPLHPLGVLADLERPDEKRETSDFSDPAKWRKQLQESLRSLLEYRANWNGMPDENFIDEKSIFRTKEGHRLYSKWREFWNL